MLIRIKNQASSRYEAETIAVVEAFNLTQDEAQRIISEAWAKWLYIRDNQWGTFEEYIIDNYDLKSVKDVDFVDIYV